MRPLLENPHPLLLKLLCLCGLTVLAGCAADRQRINEALETTLREGVPCGSSSLPAPPDIAISDSPAAIGHPVVGDALAELKAAHPADDYLRLRVSDYGQTPRRWRAAYVSFEVVSTLAIAAGLYVHKLTRPVAGAYLIEESIEEFSEGYAGFWALNRLSRPVRIEADLIDGETGSVLWHEAHTGLAPWSWSPRTSKVARRSPVRRHGVLLTLDPSPGFMMKAFRDGSCAHMNPTLPRGFR